MRKRTPRKKITKSISYLLSFIFICSIVVGPLQWITPAQSVSAQADTNLRLHYNRPADKNDWVSNSSFSPDQLQPLPIGNGYMGASIYGTLQQVEDAIDYAKNILDSNDYKDDEALQKYQDLITEAEKLLADDTTTDTEIQDILNRLKDAEKELTLKSQIDLRFLAEEIRLANLIIPDLEENHLDLSKDNFMVFRTALQHAESILENPQDQENVDNAALALLEARMSLRLKPNKDALKSLLDESGLVDPAAYTAGSYANLAQAMAFAQEVYNNPLATEVDVKEAENTLHTALVNLIPIGQETESDSETEDNSGSESDSRTESGSEHESNPESESNSKHDSESDSQTTSGNSNRESQNEKGGKSISNSGKVKTGDTALLSIFILLCASSFIFIIAVTTAKVFNKGASTKNTLK